MPPRLDKIALRGFFLATVFFQATGASTFRLDIPDGLSDSARTTSLQAFLNRSEDTLVLPPRPGGYVTGPLHIRRSGLTLLMMPGTELRAAAGAFPTSKDCLLKIKSTKNVAVIGYGARLVMRKQEYTSGEWRHAISIRGAHHVRIEGLTIDSSGGDGIYVDGAHGERTFSENIVIRNCHIRGHRRQGISVISAENLLVENCRIEGTAGTSHESGIDFEPDHADQKLVNCRVRNCVFSGNRQYAAAAYLAKLNSASYPISIGFENCLFVKSDSGSGVGFWGFDKKPVGGAISLQRCSFRGKSGPLFSVRDWKPGAAAVSLRDCDSVSSPDSTIRMAGFGPLPPPLLQSFASIPGGCEITLGNWAIDSLSHRIARGQWIPSPWGAKVRLQAGDTLRAVSRRKGLVSDTMVWEAPRYLRKGFGGLIPNPGR